MTLFFQTLRHLACVTIVIAMTVGQLLAQCTIGFEGASPSHPAACANQTATFGSGAYRDISIIANTYYNFTWNNNGAPNINGFCATPQNGAGSSGAFTTNQTGWFSGSTTVLRVSANRSSGTWNSTSAALTYRRTEPTLTANSPLSQTICAGEAASITGGAATFGTRYWQSTTVNGTSTTTPGSPNSTGTLNTPGMLTYYYRPDNGGCWGNQQASTVDVLSTPTANAGAAIASICQGGTTVGLGGAVGGSATGGTWSTPSGGTFTPNASTLNATWTPPVNYNGTATLTLTTTGMAPCSAVSASKTVTVIATPTANAGSPTPDICQGGTTAGLGGSVGGGATGGTWTSSAGGSFGGSSPATTTWTPPVGYSGTATLTLTTTGMSPCSAVTATKTVTVNPPPVVSFSSLGGPYCISQSSPVSLTSLGTPTPSPGTGVFSGTGVSGSDFIPSQAAVGSNTLTYTYTDVNGCTGTAQQTVAVTGLPLVSFSGLGTSYCINNSTPVALTGFPAGGTFSGPGISGNSFTPSAANVGLHNITYTYTDGNSCVNTQTQSVNVFALPLVGIFDLAPEYCVTDVPVTISGFPSGGTFSGTGMTGNTFNPAAATVGGPYTITYSFTDGNNCGNSATGTVSVNDVTNADAGAGGNSCSLDFQLGAVPSIGTGTWTQTTGPGSVAFSPNANSANAVATVSAYGTYTFTWTEVNGDCNSSDQVTVNYYQQPAADAGSGGTECDLDFVLRAVPSFGTGQWTLTSGPGSASFVNSTSAGSTVSVSTSGTYEFTWTETSGSCISSDAVAVVFLDQPTSDAGPDADECDLDHVMAANSSFGNGVWSLVSGPGNAVFTDAISPTSLVTVDAYGTYVFEWDETNGSCGDAATVTINFYEQPVTNAGFGGFECAPQAQLSAVPSVGVGTWTSTGPGTASFSPDANDPNAEVTVSVLGAYTFTWTEINGTCLTSDDVTITFQQQTSADAGVGGDECDDSFTFNGAPSFGTGTWTFSGPGTPYYINVADPNTSVIVDTYGSYIFTWSETNGTCITSDQVTVNFYEQPVADAGNGGDECDLDFTFNGTASVGIGTWTQTSGPGTSTYDDVNSATTAVTVDQYGTYTYTWTELNGTCSDAESITVNFYAQPVADAGNGGDVCDLYFTFNGTASAGVGTWTQISGPGTSTFDDVNSATTTVTVDAFGGCTYVWTEVSGTCSDSDTITVNFYEQPVADAGSGGDECDLDFVLNGTASVGVGLWAQTSGSGTATFSDSSSPTATVTVDLSDTYTFTWTETNGSCSDAATVTVSFSNQTVADAGNGGDECDLDFDLSAIPSLGEGVWTQTAGLGTALFGDETAANTTVTVDLYGTYIFTWTEASGNCVSSDEVEVNFYGQPVADAGQGGVECDLDFNLNATLSTGTGTWVQTSGDGVSSFAPDANDPEATVTVSQYGSYSFTWTEENGVCSDSQTIAVDFYIQPVADAGVVTDQCDLDITLAAVASAGDGTWSYQGPGMATFFPSANAATATATVDPDGPYDFTWTEDNNGCIDSETVSVTFNALPEVSFTGLAATYCDGQAIAVPLTGTPAGGTFDGDGVLDNDFIPFVLPVGIYAVTYSYTDGNGCSNSATQAVEVTANPVVSFAGLDAEYCLDENAAIALTGSPAGGTFSGTGIIGDDFVPSDAGVHVITYEFTDALGCMGSEEQTVTVNALPVVSFSGLNSAYCEDAGTVTLVSSPAGAVFSGPGVSGDTFSPSVAGVGTITIAADFTDANGCSNSTSQSVTINALPEPVISPNSVQEICAGSSVVLDAGAGYAEYDWTTNQNVQNITVTEAGFYSVTVTSAEGCEATSSSVEVVVNALPVVDLGNDTTVCVGGFLTLDAGNAGLSHVWSTQEVTQQISVSTAAIYDVEVTDGNGCVGTDAIAVAFATVAQPGISASGPTAFCQGQSVTLIGPANVDYDWSTGETSQNITVFTAGSVTLTITDQNGCTATSNAISVSVNPLPSAAITADGSTNICDGQDVTLTANGSGIYSWSPGGQVSSSITVSTSGLYSVTVTDPNTGCSTTSQPTTVAVNQTVTPTIVADGPLSFCEGDNVVLSIVPVNAYQTYLWTDGSTEQTTTATESGEYAIQVIDNNNCLNTVTLSNPFIVTVWSPDPEIVQSGGLLQVLNGPFSSYQWFRNGNPVPGATGSTFSPGQSGNFSVTVTDEHGCEASTSNIEFTHVGIDDVEVYGLNIYPNPNSGQFTVEAELGTNTDVTLVVRDVTGRELMQPERIQSASAFRRTFDISHLANGIYQVQVSGEAGMVVRQIVKQ